MSKLVPGCPVSWRDRDWILLDIPSIDRVLIKDSESGQMEFVLATELRAKLPAGRGTQGHMTIPDKAWNEAWRRFVWWSAIIESELVRRSTR